VKKFLITLAAIYAVASQTFAASHHEGLSPEVSLKLLREGNQRFVNMSFKRPNLNKTRMQKLAKEGQTPFAVVIACSDSRVSLEHIFDRGLGDLFEIKNAGNLIDDHVIGSVEYALAHLGTKLVVVMGHSCCGCVETAIADPEGETEYIQSLIKDVKPAIKMADTQTGDRVYNVAKNNAVLNAKILAESDRVIDEYIKNKGVVIVPAYYDLETGKVTFFTDEQITSQNIDK